MLDMVSYLGMGRSRSRLLTKRKVPMHLAGVPQLELLVFRLEQGWRFVTSMSATVVRVAYRKQKP